MIEVQWVPSSDHCWCQVWWPGEDADGVNNHSCITLSTMAEFEFFS